jgi:hypothetical protein
MRPNGEANVLRARPAVRVVDHIANGVAVVVRVGQDRIMPSGGSANFDHLIPLFSDIESWMSAAEQRSLGQPTPRSALGTDNKLLGVYPGSHLILAGISGAIDHLDAFRQLLVKAQALHAAAPITLLRAALEEAGLALWLTHPSNQQERLYRALRAHHRDMRDRVGYETIKPPNPGPKGKTALQRCEEIRDLAVTLGIDKSRVAAPLSATAVLGAACIAVGAIGADGLRLWHLSSGLAHGRHWTVMHGYEVRGVKDAGGGIAVLQIAGNEDVVTRMTKLSHALVRTALARYQHMSQMP